MDGSRQIKNPVTLTPPPRRKRSSYALNRWLCDSNLRLRRNPLAQPTQSRTRNDSAIPGLDRSDLETTSQYHCCSTPLSPTPVSDSTSINTYSNWHVLGLTGCAVECTRNCSVLGVEKQPTFIISWEANRFSASHEITRILWNRKVHYRVYKFPSPVPVLS